MNFELHITNDFWRTIPNKYRYLFCFCIVVCYCQPNDGTTTVDVALRVEDEVAETVENGLFTVSLAGLAGVRVVADKGVGSRIHQLVGIVALAGHHLLVVFPAPVQAHDDVTLWVGLA